MQRHAQRARPPPATARPGAHPAPPRAASALQVTRQQAEILAQKKVKVAINGFGRIGRNFLRCWEGRENSLLDVVRDRDARGGRDARPHPPPRAPRRVPPGGGGRGARRATGRAGRYFCGGKSEAGVAWESWPHALGWPGAGQRPAAHTHPALRARAIVAPRLARPGDGCEKANATGDGANCGLCASGLGLGLGRAVVGLEKHGAADVGGAVRVWGG